MRRLLTLALVLLLLPAPGQAAGSIYPGARVIIAGNSCTLNFVFTGSGKTYVGTAGHCGNVGKEAKVGGQLIGTVRFSRNDDTLDFALIEILQTRTGEVDPAVKGFGRIAGAIEPAGTTFGDELYLHGHGVLLGDLPQTRSRSGLLVQDTDEWYSAQMPAVNGDSGGPVVHARSRKALGIVSAYGVAYGQPTTDRGPTVAHILRALRAEGFNVSLV